MAILPGSRIRKNGVFGTTTDNPLTAGAGTFNSAALADLPVVTGNHAIITLDPLKQFGAPEIVMVTAHTAAATVATITRGMFGTVARSHPVNTLWVHAATQDDFIQLATSGARPADQYEGMFIFESDTNKLMGFGGVDWAPRDAGGQLANGYAQVVANQGGIVAAVDLTGLTVTVTVGTGRRIKVSGHVGSQNDTANGGALIFTVKDGGVVQTTFSGTEGVATEGRTILPAFVESPTAGSHTYKFQMQRANTGTVTMVATASRPAFILVEDIGAA